MGTAPAVTASGAHPTPALLVIDMQNTLVAIAHRAPATVAAIAGLRTRARAAGAPVVFAQQEDEELEPGTDGWRIVSGLTPAAGDPVVPKTAPDSFLGTELDAALPAAEVDFGHGSPSSGPDAPTSG